MAHDTNDQDSSYHDGTVGLAKVSNTFRCRHLNAVSVRNLLSPSHASNGSNGSQHKEKTSVIPDQVHLLSDEEVLSPVSDTTESSEAQGPRDHERAKSPNGDGLAHGIAVTKPRRKDLEQQLAEAVRPPLKSRVSRSASTALVEARQQAFEERIHARRLDSFFSLHRLDSTVGINEEPVYVSETQEKFMNPDYKPFMSGDILDASFLRGRTFAIRIWTRSPGDKQYSLLIEERVAVPELYFVCEELEFSEAKFRDNTVLFHLPDGIYASYTHSTFDKHPGRAASKAPESKSASFDTLMRLKKLVEVIDNAAATQETIRRQIEAILSDSEAHETISRSKHAGFSLQTVRDTSARLDKDITRLKAEKDLRLKNHDLRSRTFEDARAQLRDKESFLRSVESDIMATQELHKTLKTSLKSHTARIAEDLLHIFPIEPFDGPQSASSTPASSRPSSASSSRRNFNPGLAFTIRGLHIPHASILAQTHPHRHDMEVSAALGYAGTVVMFLSRTLLLQIPFPIFVLGSHSIIRDDITPDLDLISNRLLLPSQVDSRVDEIGNASLNNPSGRTGWEVDGARSFPLYARNADPARFRWAVYLLNRDIEELVSRSGLRVVDVRDTLANLKLLLVALAGGDRDANLPRREVGRVAGLHLHRP